MHEDSGVEELTDQFKMYMNVNFEIAKLEAVESIAVFAAGIFSNIVIMSTSVLFIFFLSFAASNYISARMGNNYSGFLIFAAIYLIVGVLLRKKGKKLIIEPVRDKIIQNILNRD